MFGIVFDIDGVLLRGSRSLPGASWVISKLEQKHIPYCLLTNGGGVLEEKKIASVTKALGFPNIKGHMILSHTPFRDTVAKEYQDKRCLILGCREEVEVAKHYGFRKVVTPQALAAQYPLAYHNWGRVHKRIEDPYEHEPIEAIVIMHDPVDYHLELQICIDVLRGRYPVSTKQLKKAPVIFNSNDDLEFASPFDHPRLAQGTFLHCLELLHEKCPGALGPLEIIRYGKPHKVTYQFCEKQFPQTVERFYMIGDNPAADIRGANGAGDHWTSILVKTGVFSGLEKNSLSDPADYVVADVKEAMEKIFELEKIII